MLEAIREEILDAVPGLQRSLTRPTVSLLCTALGVVADDGRVEYITMRTRCGDPRFRFLMDIIRVLPEDPALAALWVEANPMMAREWREKLAAAVKTLINPFGRRPGTQNCVELCTHPGSPLPPALTAYTAALRMEYPTRIARELTTMMSRVIANFGIQDALLLSATVLLKPDGTSRTAAEAAAHAASSCSDVQAWRERLVKEVFAREKGASDAMTRLGYPMQKEYNEAVLRALRVLGSRLGHASFYWCFGGDACRDLVRAVLWDQENDVLMEEAAAGEALADSVRAKWQATLLTYATPAAKRAREELARIQSDASAGPRVRTAKLPR